MYFDLNELRNLTEERINDLIKNCIPESKTLDYKEQLPGEEYEDKKNFLGDVSSFANSDGGNIVYGIQEEKGIPVNIEGVEVDNPDAEVLRFENLIRDCTEPRLQGILIKPFKLSNSKYIFIFYIPKSFNPPHVVKIKSHWRFYSRNSASSYVIEVSELRSMITLSSSIRERIRNFRIERISLIKNQELEIPISKGPKFIYHIIPLSSFATEKSINLVNFEHSQIIRHELFRGFNKRFNYEGILFHNHQENYAADLYIQIFRNGTIEFFDSTLHNNTQRTLSRNNFENKLIKFVPQFIEVLNFFDLNIPLLVFCSVLDVKGYKINLYSHEVMKEMQNRTIIKNDFILPEILLNDVAVGNLPLALKPLFDPIWNAAGHSQSPNYDSDGNWKIVY